MCNGRVEIEHAELYAGRQIPEMWNYVPVCTWHHRGAGLDKNLNQYEALSRATDADLAKYPKVDWKQKLKYLKSKYDHQRIYRSSD